MDIPDGAMDAAMAALEDTFELVHDDPCVTVAAILEAAAPFIVAQVWEDGYWAGDDDRMNKPSTEAARPNPYREETL